jgi:hypothetical protein
MVRYPGSVRSTTLTLLIVLGAVLQVACSTDTPADGLNAPCTRTRDCVDGLQCLGGFCNGGDAGVADGASNGDASSSDAFDTE